MARYRRGRMALYEVMSKAKLKPGYGRTLEKMRPEQAIEEEPVVETDGVVAADEAVVGEEIAAVESPPAGVRWWRKPRKVQLNAGRIEFSLPYALAIAIVLGVIAAVLVAFRLGQLSLMVTNPESSSPPTNVTGNRANLPVRTSERAAPEPGTTGRTTQETGNVGPVTSTGSMVIVLVEYKARADLVPAQAHFANYGIATEIVSSGGRYFLITKDRFDDFGPGSAGLRAKQKIIEVGALYKGRAPEGYEPFAPHYFSDAYPRRLSDIRRNVG